MSDRRERRFLLLAGLLVLASWALVGWGLWAKGHQLYHTEQEPAWVVRRLPDGRYLVRLERGQVVRRLPDAAGGPDQMSPAGLSERERVVYRLPDGRYLVKLLGGETAVVEIPDHIARTQPSVTVIRRAYLFGFKTKWRTITY